VTEAVISGRICRQTEVTRLAAGLLAGFRHRETMTRVTDRTEAAEYRCVKYNALLPRRRPLLFQPAGVFYASGLFRHVTEITSLSVLHMRLFV